MILKDIITNNYNKFTKKELQQIILDLLYYMDIDSVESATSDMITDGLNLLEGMDF